MADKCIDPRHRSTKTATVRWARLLVGLPAVLAALSLLALAPSIASAKKVHLFQEEFGSVAQPKGVGVGGLAVDQSTGDLLVIDSNTQTVSRYNPDGTPDAFSALGTNTIDGMGNGECATVPADCDQTPQGSLLFRAFAGEQQVAVDNSGTATDGNIYVTQGPQAAGNLVNVFAASGKYLGQLTAAGTTKFGTGTTGSLPFSPCGVAVDGSGNVFLAGGFDNKIYKFDPSANPPVNGDNTATFNVGKPVCNLAAGAGPSAGSLFANRFFSFQGNSVLRFDTTSGVLQSIVDPGEDRLITVDPVNGHLIAIGGTVVNGNLANEELKDFNAAGSLISGVPEGGTGIAVDGAGGKLYVGSSGSIKVFGPLVAVPDVTTEAATINGETSVALNGTVNPDGVALEECFFEYGLSTAYGQTAPCAESVGEIGTTPKAVHADLIGLDKETVYHYRLVAKNPNGAIRGEDGSLKTPSKPAIKAQWAADVGFSEATLKATINPENSPTTYRFEYGIDSSYGQSTAEIAVGSDATDHTVRLLLHDLTPGASYHWRVVATNNIATIEGDDHAFTTYASVAPANTACPNQAFRGGGAAKLPDCRAYEMVSPVEKNNTDIAPLIAANNFLAAHNQSALSGERLTYTTSQGFGGAQGVPYVSQYLAARGAGGWQNQGITPPQGMSEADLVGRLDVDFRAFTDDLCVGVVVHFAPPPLSADAPAGFPNLYRRDNCGGGGYEVMSPTEPPNRTPANYKPEVQGISADGSCTVFAVGDQMTADANPLLAPNGIGTNDQLYESCAGAPLRLISALPNGEASTVNSSVGTPNEALPIRFGSVEHAVSEDGSRVYWSEVGFSEPSRLYVRVNAREEQSEISAGKCTEPEKACTIKVFGTASGASPHYWGASPEGAVAWFSVPGVKTPLGELGNLYEFELESKKTTLVAPEVLGVMGMSKDASRVYLVSKKATLAGANAQGVSPSPGERNLYLYEKGEEGGEEGSFSFVATIASDGAYSPTAAAPVQRTSRVSPDGAHAAFMSSASLTGYDNADSAGGEPVAEIYVYGAESGELHCVSCNPTGQRPTGRDIPIELGPSGTLGAAFLRPYESELHGSHALSADGSRLFFDGYEALVPYDTNGRTDVYEWEAPGAGDCSESAPTYSPPNGGCLSLISSGESATDSSFLDASADGRDVFFTTDSSLLPQDPGLIDIYDARAGGGFPPAPNQPAACEGEACQGPLAPPNDPTPASSAYEGAGNVKAAAKKKAAKRHKKAKQKKHRRKAKSDSQRRANHERRAQR